VVVYFSGHGKADGDHFYLIPQDLVYIGPRDQLTTERLRQILAHSISDMELEDALRVIDAGQIFMIIDAWEARMAKPYGGDRKAGNVETEIIFAANVI
jgi:hypothetical protein